MNIFIITHGVNENDYLPWVVSWSVKKKNSLSLARFNVNTSKPSPHSTHKKIIKNKKGEKSDCKSITIHREWEMDLNCYN